MEKAFASILQGLPRHAGFSVGFAADDGQVGHTVRFENSLRQIVPEPIQAIYPRCTVAERETTVDRLREMCYNGATNPRVVSYSSPVKLTSFKFSR